MSNEFDDDDDDAIDLEADPSEDEPCDKKSPAYKLTIENLSHDAIMAAVYEKIAKCTEAKLTAEHMTTIKKTIERCVNDAVERIVDARLEKEVNDILDNGWQQYDRWGNPSGSRTTLRELVTKYIMTEVDQHGRDGSDRYADSGKRQRILWYVEKAINSIFDKEMHGIVEKFRKTVRERFDAKLAADVAETLKSAIGLR